MRNFAALEQKIYAKHSNAGPNAIIANSMIRIMFEYFGVGNLA